MSRLRRSRSGTKTTIILIFFFLLAGAGAALFFLFFEGERPLLAITSPDSYLGKNSIISIEASDAKSGIRQVKLQIRQGDIVKELYSEEIPRKGLTGTVGLPEKLVEIPFKASESGFKDGTAQVGNSRL